MFGVELICSDEACTYVLDTTVWTLDQAEAHLCDGCGCTLAVSAVYDVTEVRARPPALLRAAA